MGKIIGLTGLSGTGKSVVARYLEQNEKYAVISLGDQIRRMYTNEQCSGSIEDYAEKFRFSSIGEHVTKDLIRYKQDDRIIVVDSIRSVADYCFFKKHASNFALVMVVADRQKRIERLSARKRKGDCENRIKLQGHDFWELCYGIDKLIALTDKYIVNNWGVKELFDQVENCFSIL